MRSFDGWMGLYCNSHLLLSTNEGIAMLFLLDQYVTMTYDLKSKLKLSTEMLVSIF